MENKSTKLDKAVKISIIVGALIIALSVAYYLVIFMPQKEKARVKQQALEETKEQAKVEAKELEAKKDKCFVDAKKFHEVYIGTIGWNYQYFEPKFGYNKRLGKCLYSGGYTNGNKDWGREVKDIYTNETLLSASGLIAEAIATTNSAEKSKVYLENFWSEHNSLFNE